MLMPRLYVIKYDRRNKLLSIPDERWSGAGRGDSMRASLVRGRWALRLLTMHAA